MRKSIFEIENKLDIDKEFKTFVGVLNIRSSVVYRGSLKSLYSLLNDDVFNLWEYRDTFTNIDDYLNHIGVDKDTLLGLKPIGKIQFLNYIELIINLMGVMKEKIGGFVAFTDVKVENIVYHNVPIILEKMNYEMYKYNDNQLRLRKRDSDVDSILECVPSNISDLLLSYNDIRSNNFKSKKSILKDIDLYIEENKNSYKSNDNKLYDSIQTIINKMGVNHPIAEEPFTKLSEDEIIEWYDKCFKMMIHLIRSKEINKIKKERDNLINLMSGNDKNEK